MIMDGLILGTMSFAGGYLVYRKLPPRLKNFLNRHDLFTDISMGIMTYAVMGGGTVTGLTAAAWAGILTSVALYVAKHPEEYAWLHEFAEEAKKAWSSCMAALKSMLERKGPASAAQAVS